MTHNIKSALRIILALLLTGAFATSKAQTFLSEDWNGSTGSLPMGWTTTGTDKTPEGEAAEWFSKGEGWKVLENDSYSGPFAASYSSTAEGGKVDTWLISPEFEVPVAGGFVEFPVWTSGSDDIPACKMSVRITTEGSTPEAFTDPALLTTRIRHDDGITGQLISLADYAGKKVRMAIVNEGTQAGTLCVGNIEATVCRIDISNRTPLLAAPDSNVAVSLVIDVKAICPGFDVTLTTSDGQSQTKSYNKDIQGGLSGYELTFPCGRPAGDVFSYTVSVAPHIEGVAPTEYSSSLAIGEGYPQICLMEEATGENCGYCPAGTAAIERFGDMYADRFIGVGVHCTRQFSTGVMENQEYAEPYLSSFQIASLPNAVLNRSMQVSPTDYAGIDEAVKALLEGRSAGHILIDRVDCDKATGETSVRFTAGLCAPLTDMQLNAIVILTADNLTGTSRKWFQSDYFSGMTEEKFLSQADASWWPYMKFWCEYPDTKVSPTDRAFDHVGMGVYPDFYGDGCKLPEDWSDGKSKSEAITFAMPMQTEYDGFGVQDVNETAVTIVLLNAGDGSVVAAQQVKAADYNRDLTAVSDVMADSDIHAWTEGGELLVESEDCAAVEVFTTDGRMIYSGYASVGISRHEIGDMNGMLIVRIGERSMKIMH